MTKWVLAAAMACVLSTGAVAVAEDSYYLELPTKGITASRKITVNVPDENPAQDGINPLTGESWYGNYYPILVNIDALNRAGCSAHSIFHVGAFESRPRRRGCANQPFAISEHEFGIGADIDQQPVFILFVRFLGYDHGAGICADEGCNGGQHVDIARGVDVQSQFARLDIH